MKFPQKIYQVISTELAGIIAGGIYSHNLPDNFRMGDQMLLIQYRNAGRSATLDDRTEQSNYELSLVMISKSTQLNEEKKIDVVDKLDDFIDPDQLIIDLTYVDDLNTFDEETGLYVKLLNYTVIFNN